MKCAAEHGTGGDEVDRFEGQLTSDGQVAALTAAPPTDLVAVSGPAAGELLASPRGRALVALVAWLASWALLHFRLRGRQVDVGGVAVILLCALVAATLLLWPPISRSLAMLVR